MIKMELVIIFLLINAPVAIAQNLNWIYIADSTSRTNNISLTFDDELLVSRANVESNSVARLNLEGDLIWEENVCSCTNAGILISAETLTGELIHLTVLGNLYKTNSLGIESIALGNVIPEMINPYIRDAQINNGYLNFAGRGQLNGDYNLFRGNINLNDLNIAVNNVKSDLKYNSFSINSSNNLWYEVLSNENLQFIGIYDGLTSTLIDSFSIDSFDKHAITDIVYLDEDNIIQVGYKNLDYVNWKGIIRSINSDGQENYLREYEGIGGNGNILLNTIEIFDNKILVGGSNQGAIYLAEIDLNGDIIAEYQNDLSIATDNVNSIQKGVNNDIILAGTAYVSDIIQPLRSYVLSISDITLGSNGLGSESLVVYPNPSMSEISIHSSNDEIVNLELYSLSGSKLFGNSGNSIKIDQLANGIYILKIYLKDRYIIRKVMKSN